MTVSVFEDSDDDLGEKLREYLEKDILCVIIGSYIQCQMTGYFRSIVNCIFLKKEMRRYSLLLTLVPRKQRQIQQLKIGTSIILKNVSVWVTFDKRFYTCLMGQDILDKLYYMHWSNTPLFIANNVNDSREYIDCMEVK